jgi:adenine-specific DNA-methyltransferase
MAKKKPADKPAAVPVEVHKHVADKRPNIPTRETAAFAVEDGPPRFVVERDRALDPQLVWKGKDEQDARPLEVPAVPLHVHEKIQPQAVVEDLKARARQARPACDLFADFNGLDDFRKKLEFYQHDQHWTNRLILGDSLLVMASLAEKERLRGQVQCVYFDPPYGIKFGSNWQVSTRKRNVKDAKAEDLTRQTASNTSGTQMTFRSTRSTTCGRTRRQAISQRKRSMWSKHQRKLSSAAS